MFPNGTMLRDMVTTFLLIVFSVSTLATQKTKRQVTYQVTDSIGTDENFYLHLMTPGTKRPLPSQVIYPGDLTNFITTKFLDDKNLTDNITEDNHNSSKDRRRLKRSLYGKYTKHNNPILIKIEKQLKSSLPKYSMSESGVHTSYHEPSVTVINDIPAEMYFDGAGFLRYEDDSAEKKNTFVKSQNNKSYLQSHQDNSEALKLFHNAFNVSNERNANNLKFHNEAHYSNDVTYKDDGEKILNHGTENGTPLRIDFMKAYQNEIIEHLQDGYSQANPNINTFKQDSSFIHKNFYDSHSDFNKMPLQQLPLWQNHQLQSTQNNAKIAASSLYSISSNQPLNSNSGYASNLKFLQYSKRQRKRRSVIISENTNEKIVKPNRKHYQYSIIQDQQDSSSGFIPITGSFNGGTIQLNFPIFNSNPISNGYPPRQPPMHTYHTYSIPFQSGERHYRKSMDHFYHPSEARRYSYGILGSGNFEVIKGGVFPSDRYHGYSGYQNGRIPYRGNGYGNYGTTEIILDGPIQGFQGFDNFPAHLINALSKHSELTVHPDQRKVKDLSL